MVVKEPHFTIVVDDIAGSGANIDFGRVQEEFEGLSRPSCDFI